MRVVIYTRISEDKTGEALGVSRQLDDCLALAAQRGWTVTDERVENDVSAAGKRKRPEFEEMLRQVRDGEVDAVVAWSLDRLTRNRRDTLRLIETCEPRRAVISLVRGSDLDLGTPAGRMTAGILAEVARHEIEVKADRQRNAAVQAAKQGRPPGGPRPFGFAADRVSLQEDEAAAVRDGYDVILAGGSLASVARDWNARGLVSGKVRTSAMAVGQASSWSAETVRAVLLKPRNAGLRSRHGEVVGAACWPPIVTEETWRAAVAYLTDPGRRMRSQAPPNARYMLSGVGRCGVCSAPVNAGTHRGRYHAYRCRAALGHVARRGDDADNYVSSLVIARLSRPDAIELCDSRTRPDVAVLRGQATVLRKRLEDMAVEFADGVLTAGQLRAASERLRERIAALEAEIADAGRVDVLAPLLGARDRLGELTQEQWQEVVRVFRGWFSIAAAGIESILAADSTDGVSWSELGEAEQAAVTLLAVAAAWWGMSNDQRRPVIELLMSVVLHPVGRGARVFDPATVAIEWKIDQG